jgi:zinc protease
VSEYQGEMAELLTETLADFSISDEIINREKASMLESLRSRKDSPSTIASLNFQKMLFKNHNYAQDPLGTPESVASLSSVDVRDYLENLLSSQNAVASLSGEFDLNIWKKALTPLSDKKIEDHHLKMLPLAPLQKDLYQFEAAVKEQTHIIYGFHGLSLDDPERFTLQVLEAVLAGQGGRLFIELRDKASLAYSVSPLRMEGLGAGYFATYIGCSPEKTETAIKMMKDELNKMVEQPISKDELRRAQSYLIGGHDIGLQKNSAISSSIAFNEVYGNSYRELFDYGDLVSLVTAEQVQKLAKRLFLQKSALSIVGPREPQ